MGIRMSADENVFPYDVEVVAINLFVPWAIDISKEGRLYVSERSGSIWAIENGNFLPEPIIRFAFPFVSQGEGGLLGIALDPDFETNHFIYAMHSYYEDGKLYNRVVRLIEENNKATVDKVILDKIPTSNAHNGGRIKIGPDHKLYITTGDGGFANLSQDVSSLAGKILRINLDGTIPEDNPYPNSPVYSIGLRNPQGLAWGKNGELYATEHGPVAHDEINQIRAGANYGWPIVKGNEETQSVGVQKPLVQSENETWAPSGMAYINQGPWEGSLLVGELFGKGVLQVRLSEEGSEVVRVVPWLENSFGRIREVYQAADGSVYLTTSNRDGRGSPDATDDKIIRLIPKNMG